MQLEPDLIYRPKLFPFSKNTKILVFQFGIKNVKTSF